MPVRSTRKLWTRASPRWPSAAAPNTSQFGSLLRVRVSIHPQQACIHPACAQSDHQHPINRKLIKQSSRLITWRPHSIDQNQSLEVMSVNYSNYQSTNSSIHSSIHHKTNDSINRSTLHSFIVKQPPTNWTVTNHRARPGPHYTLSINKPTNSNHFQH